MVKSFFIVFLRLINIIGNLQNREETLDQNVFLSISISRKFMSRILIQFMQKIYNNIITIASVCYLYALFRRVFLPDMIIIEAHFDNRSFEKYIERRNSDNKNSFIFTHR